MAGKGTLISGVVPPPGCPVPVLTLASQLFLGSWGCFSYTGTQFPRHQNTASGRPCAVAAAEPFLSFLAALNLSFLR